MSRITAPVFLMALFFTMAANAYENTYNLGSPKNDFKESEVQPWVEDSVVPPELPSDSNLVPFYVGETTSHRFFIDATSLTLGKDGVVRYVLVVRTSGGATNITFEGMRCGLLEYKVYASGRQDGTWALARKPEWRAIENKPVNRYHAALARNYFCPNRSPILTADEGRDALRLGKHPGAM